MPTQAAAKASSSPGLSGAAGFESYRQWSAEAITPMDITTPDVAQFAAGWQVRHLGPLSSIRLRASPLRIFSQPQKNADERYQVLMPLSGSILCNINGQAVQAAPGQMVVLSNHVPYHHDIAAYHHAIILSARRDWIERWLPDPDRHMAMTYPITRGWGAPYAKFMRALHEAEEEPALSDLHMAEQVGALLSLAARRAQITTTRHKQKLLTRVLAEIERQAAEPALTPHMIATELSLSKRYIHGLLAESGTTFSAEVNRIRLTHAARMLCDAGFQAFSIAEIAWRCGYQDPSYFSRVYKRRFGSSPAAARKARE